MAREPSRSPAASELEVLRAEIKILKKQLAELRGRISEVEDELNAMRSLFTPTE